MIKMNKTRIKNALENIKIRIKYLLISFQIKFKIFIEKQKKILDDPKTFYLILKNITRHFCNNTALHGYRFISLIHLTVIERFVWTFICLCALLTALSLIFLSLSYENLKGATITMTDSTYHPIYTYSFPAISICNFNKISKKKSYELADRLADDIKDIPSIQKDLVYLTNLYFPHHNPKDEIIYKRIEEILACQNLTAEKALKQITPSCTELLAICKLKGRITRCDALFQDIITPEGTCCTFNHFAMKNKKFTGYNAERYKYIPKKLVSCGADMGINLILNVNQEDYYASEFAAVGSKILIHHPYNYPEWNSKSIMLSPSTIASISIVPYQTYSTKEIIHINIKDRGCVFSFERSLRIFTNYTHQNCLNECRINLILKLCECIPFYYINDDVDAFSNYRTCNLSDTSCLSKHKGTYLSSIPGKSEEDIKDPSKHPWGEEYDSCDCPPSCENLEFITSETKTNLVVNKLSSIISNGNMSVINIFYKNLFGTLNKTDVYKRWHALLGLLGGLLGLCIGFSMTGAFDIPYYYILRLLYDIHTGIKIRPEQNPKDQYKKAAVKMNLFNPKKKKMTDGKKPITNISSLYKSIKPKRMNFNLSDLNLFKYKKPEYYPYLE